MPILPFGGEAATKLAQALSDPNVGRFAADHVLTLSNEQATKQAIVESLGQPFLVSKALPNDLIILYFCSRAVPSKDGQAVMLCAYDTASATAQDSGVLLPDVLSQLRKRTQCKNIICLLDLSPVFDNSVSRLPSSPPQGKCLNISPLTRLAQMSSVNLLSANELFNPSYQSPARQNSYFGYHLTEALKQSAGQKTLADLSQIVAENVANDVRNELQQEESVKLCLTPESAYLAALPLGISISRSGPSLPIRIGHDYNRLVMTRPDLVLGATPDPPGGSIASRQKLSQNLSSNAGNNGQNDDQDTEPAAVDLGPYLARMRQSIRAKWRMPSGLKDLPEQKVAVVFSILKDGTISQAEIVKGSGVESVDQSALTALQSASPLPPLPIGAPRSIRVSYKFDWSGSSQ